MHSSANRIAAVLFDMDGVLIDSNAVIERGWAEGAQMFGKTLTEEDIVRHIHGQPGPHTIRALFSDLSLEDQKKVQSHIIHVENTADYDPIPGVSELIQALHKAGISVGIVTSGWRSKIDRIMEMLQITPCISVIVERDDVVRGKPYPDPYLLAAERFHLAPSRTLVFEDSRSGVTSAVTAGAICVGIGTDSLKECGAVLAITDFRNVKIISQTGEKVVIAFTPEHQMEMETQSSRKKTSCTTREEC
ncbi:HAD family phosphatase [Escherichia coli]|nr:HAD family phosphatase [Escherichia coli]EIE7464293.1 HAD family phosphatase [Escherichia coli]MDD8132893.1 HAD family phosphatase [Escherichia coli]HCU6026699.1 HAD family phosphatase [Escherichia coli]HCU6748047.1 HAD family phosphatase [Escherichia coli]